MVKQCSLPGSCDIRIVWGLGTEESWFFERFFWEVNIRVNIGLDNLFRIRGVQDTQTVTYEASGCLLTRNISQISCVLVVVLHDPNVNRVRHEDQGQDRQDVNRQAMPGTHVSPQDLKTVRTITGDR